MEIACLYTYSVSERLVFWAGNVKAIQEQVHFQPKLNCFYSCLNRVDIVDWRRMQLMQLILLLPERKQCMLLQLSINSSINNSLWTWIHNMIRCFFKGTSKKAAWKWYREDKQMLRMNKHKTKKYCFFNYKCNISFN